MVAGKRDQRKERTRAEILRHALALYRERGFEETRVQDIIDRVGISEKTFFNYFPSKQAVLESTAEENLGLYRELLLDELSQTERPVLDRLAEVVTLWAASFTSDRDLLAVVATRTALFFGSSGSTRRQQRETQLLLADLFGQGQQRGEIRAEHDPVQLAELMTAVLMLTTVNWLDDWWGDPQEALEARLERALDVFLTGAVPIESRGQSRSRRRAP